MYEKEKMLGRKEGRKDGGRVNGKEECRSL
jgi:hypothetical protein